jgi:hypothetical protein
MSPHLLVLSSHDLEDVALELLAKDIALNLGSNAPEQQESSGGRGVGRD